MLVDAELITELPPPLLVINLGLLTKLITETKRAVTSIATPQLEFQFRLKSEEGAFDAVLTST